MSKMCNIVTVWIKNVSGFRAFCCQLMVFGISLPFCNSFEFGPEHVYARKVELFSMNVQILNQIFRSIQVCLQKQYTCFFNNFILIHHNIFWLLININHVVWRYDPITFLSVLIKICTFSATFLIQKQSLCFLSDTAWHI